MEEIKLYAGTIGKVLNFTMLEQDRVTPIVLTNATISVKLYALGSNTLVDTMTGNITDATNGEFNYTTVSGDFATSGLYYTQILLVYTGGNTRVETGPNVEVLATAVPENLVPVSDFVDFLDIKDHDAKANESIKSYLEQAESILDCDMPSLTSTTNSKYIKIKQTLIKMKAAQFYFMNSGEQFDDPNKRNPKVELWAKEYDRLLSNLNNILSTTSTGSATVRRVKHTDYLNPSSYNYLKDEQYTA